MSLGVVDYGDEVVEGEQGGLTMRRAASCFDAAAARQHCRVGPHPIMDSVQDYRDGPLVGSQGNTQGDQSIRQLTQLMRRPVTSPLQ